MTSAPLVAVTGAEGFIGSHLTEALVASGHRVRAMAQYNSFSSYGWLETLSPEVLDQVDIVLGDVRDPGSVRGLVEGAEAVYHLAALIAIPYSYQAPHSYVDTNVTGTLNVLEAVRALETPRLVHTSTSETYGTAQTVPITEDHPINTQSPYAASKAGGDRLADSYYASFGTPVVTLRPFNTYGPRQSMRAVIPTVIGQVAAARAPSRWAICGRPGTSRSPPTPRGPSSPWGPPPPSASWGARSTPVPAPRSRSGTWCGSSARSWAPSSTSARTSSASDPPTPK